MSFWELSTQQAVLFVMILAGAVLVKRGIIDDAGQRCLTDLCVSIIIPCNIVKSCFISFDHSVLRACALVFVVGTAMQLLYVALNKVCFNRFPEQQKKVLQYCTIVSNGGFLGNPVAEGIYGSQGLLYASMFLIPMRVVMWSVGTSYFIAGASMDRRQVLRNTLTHPCLVAVYVGLLVMVTQVPLSDIVVRPITYIGGCNSAITMFIIGTILSKVDLRTVLTPVSAFFSVFRLLLLPAVAFGLCLLLGMDRVATGVSVIMTGMPAGSTAAIFAARYGSDAPFATKCVVLTTLLSMVTIPLWCYIVG